MKLIFSFVHKNWDYISAGFAGSGSFMVMLTGLNMIMKLLIGMVTLYYFYIKIKKEKGK
jgi:hypothetical protein